MRLVEALQRRVTFCSCFSCLGESRAEEKLLPSSAAAAGGWSGGQGWWSQEVMVPENKPESRWFLFDRRCRAEHSDVEPTQWAAGGWAGLVDVDCVRRQGSARRGQTVRHQLSAADQLGAVNLKPKEEVVLTSRCEFKLPWRPWRRTWVVLSRSMVRSSQSGQQVSSSRVRRARAREDPLSCRNKPLEPSPGCRRRPSFCCCLPAGGCGQPDRCRVSV